MPIVANLRGRPAEKRLDSDARSGLCEIHQILFLFAQHHSHRVGPQIHEKFCLWWKRLAHRHLTGTGSVYLRHLQGYSNFLHPSSEGTAAWPAYVEVLEAIHRFCKSVQKAVAHLPSPPCWPLFSLGSRQPLRGRAEYHCQWGKPPRSPSKFFPLVFLVFAPPSEDATFEKCGCFLQREEPASGGSATLVPAHSFACLPETL